MAANPSKSRIIDAYAALITRLQDLSDPNRAEKEKAYQKSRWEHWGVALPKMDLAIRESLKGLPPQKLLARRLREKPRPFRFQTRD